MRLLFQTSFISVSLSIYRDTEASHPYRIILNKKQSFFRLIMNMPITVRIAHLSGPIKEEPGSVCEVDATERQI